jgi:NAD+ kinase
MKVLLFGQKVKDSEEFSHIKILIDCCVSFGVEIIFIRTFAHELTKFDASLQQYKTLDTHRQLVADSPDIVITLGGDGTILKAITLIKDSGIPILGINLGRLGFLASVEKKIIKKAILQMVKRDYQIIKRSLLGLTSNISLFKSFPYALNDFTLNKRDTSSMITIHTYIDDVLLNSYWADGIIISTPTGSTGYSLSCGGPIIFPDAQDFVITPVAPHNLNVRPIVIADHHKISIRVEGRTDSFMCTLDSRYETVTSDHRIEIKKGDFPIHFIELKGQSFMKTIGEKLWWGLDKRN